MKPSELEFLAWLDRRLERQRELTLRRKGLGKSEAKGEVAALEAARAEFLLLAGGQMAMFEAAELG